MISHDHKCIFIHIPKCAGNSIDVFFTGRHQRHGCMLDYEDQLGVAKLSTYFKFTVVRNPWDRIVSYFSFVKKLIQNENQPSKEMLISEYGIDFTFDDFVKNKLNVLTVGGTKYVNKLKTANQIDWIKNSKNELDIDYICKFENLQYDFNEVCDKIGIPQQQLPHKNKTKHNHYTEYYDDVTREIVANRYAEDIEYFGYKFGE